MKRMKDSEAMWAMYAAGMEVNAAHGRGTPDARQIFLAGVEAGILLSERASKERKRRRKS